ncbi:MAG: ATP-binding cassette domain-containing protein [Calditrichaeota bacterium]|nr:ATP-binding cassette domain-containing protein [Calditrichota bacterium]
MIELDGLQKAFGSGRQRVEAVSSVSLQAHPGRVFGLLGPNGAGKTTTLRVIATLLRADAGMVRVDGVDASQHPEQVRARLGFLTGDTQLYARLTARETLRFFGRLQGMSDTRIDERIGELSTLLDMDSFLDRRVGKFSTGQKQKCSIARAVIHDPQVVVLDEPTSGLDVLSSRSVVEFIRHSAQKGCTVLFSTHILSEAASLCADLAFVHRGRTVEQGPLDEIMDRHGSRDLNGIFLSVVGEE